MPLHLLLLTVKLKPHTFFKPENIYLLPCPFFFLLDLVVESCHPDKDAFLPSLEVSFLHSLTQQRGLFIIVDVQPNIVCPGRTQYANINQILVFSRLSSQSSQTANFGVLRLSSLTSETTISSQIASTTATMPRFSFLTCKQYFKAQSSCFVVCIKILFSFPGSQSCLLLWFLQQHCLLLLNADDEEDGDDAGDDNQDDEDVDDDDEDTNDEGEIRLSYTHKPHFVCFCNSFILSQDGQWQMKMIITKKKMKMN